MTANAAPLLAQMLAGAWLAQALSVAARLGIADRLAAGPLSAAELAERLETDAIATYRLLRALAGAGVFRESEDGRFALTPLASPLRADAPDSVRDYAIMAGERWVWASIGGLMHSVKTGAPAFHHLFGVPLFDYYVAHPEAGVYLVGMKSYGRAPTFLALTGYEQVRSVAAAIAGDREAAERVELVLPETGVCSGGGLVDEPGTEGQASSGGCCGPIEPIALAAPAIARR